MFLHMKYTEQGIKGENQDDSDYSFWQLDIEVQAFIEMTSSFTC